MSVRETMNAKPRLTLSVAAIGVAFAIGFAIWSLRSQSLPATPTMTFYSSDDGATFFADDLEKLSLQKDGKQTVMARVFEDAARRKFVGYLERVPPLAAGASAAAGADREVKRPGDKEWVLASSEAGMRIMSVRAQDGTDVVRVEP